MIHTPVTGTLSGTQRFTPTSKPLERLSGPVRSLLTGKLTSSLQLLSLLRHTPAELLLLTTRSRDPIFKISNGSFKKSRARGGGQKLSRKGGTGQKQRHRRLLTGTRARARRVRTVLALTCAVSLTPSCPLPHTLPSHLLRTHYCSRFVRCLQTQHDTTHDVRARHGRSPSARGPCGQGKRRRQQPARSPGRR